MTSVTDALATLIAVITAISAFGTSSFGLVEASKGFWGGAS